MAAKSDARGVTLPELLVVVAIIGLAVMVAVPTIGDAIRGARLRTATRSLEATMRAARILAVTRQQDSEVIVVPAPPLPAQPSNSENLYTYTDLQGRPRTARMPLGIRIASTTSPIVFHSNGALDADAVTVLEVSTREGLLTWEVRTSRMGVTRVID